MTELKISQKCDNSAMRLPNPFTREHPMPLLQSERRDRRTALIQEALRQPGSGLPTGVRIRMEALFGRDFSHVRLHTGSVAAASAHALNATAYTVGSSILFGKGNYRPGTWEGLWLLAHELTHVVQQGRGVLRQRLTASDEDALERAANWAADIVVAGRPVPSDFAFGTAPAGMVQRHLDVPCPGARISAGDRSIWMPANEAIELAYKNAPENRAHADAIFFGSQFENIDVRLPNGAPNKRYGNLLLGKLRGLVKQRRPDIIDFYNRVFYEIKSDGDQNQGMVQLESYYRIAETIRHAHADFDEPPWIVEYATWYPPHVLPLPLDPTKIVCTQATDHNRWPGLILYDVRQLRGRRRSHEYQLEAFEPNYAELAPAFRAQLPKAVPDYNPDSPEYVIIVPQEFFTLDYVKQKSAQWDKLRARDPRPLFPVLSPEAMKRVMELGVSASKYLIIGGVVVAAVILTDGLALAAAPEIIAAEAGTEAVVVTTAETGAVLASEAGGAVAVESTIVAPGVIAAQVAAGSDAWLAYQAMLSAPAVKAVAATAGAVLVLFNIRNAEASTSKPKPVPSNVVAMKAVAVDDFKAVAGVQSAFSTGRSRFSLPVCSDASKVFGLGTMVMYDNKPHWVFGRFLVK